jgi:hypothetical protein
MHIDSVTPPRAATPSPPKPTPEPNPKPSVDCDSHYPTVCIPDVPYDLDCPDVPYHDFAVPGADPDGFDGDNDGIGCES